MQNRITRLTTVHFGYPDSAERQQASRLLIINLAWMVMIIAASPLLSWWVIEDPHLEPGILFVPVSLAAAVLVHWSIQRGWLQRARFLFVLNIMMMSLLTIFPDYRLDSTPFTIVLLLPLTAAGVLLRRSSLLGIALLLIVAVAVGGSIQIGVGLEPEPSSGSAVESVGATIFVVALMIVLSTIMLVTFGSTIEDVTVQQHHLAHLITNTAAASHALVTMPDSDEDLNRTIEQIRDAFELYHAQVYLADPLSGLAVLRASTGFIGRRLLEEESLRRPDESSPVNNALRQTEPIQILNTAPEDQRVGFLPATQSELLLPLRVGDLLPVGVLDLHGAAPTTFSPRLVEVLTAVSNQLAAVLHGAHQTRELRATYAERDQLLERVESGRQEVARINRQLVGTTWGTYLADYREAVPGFDWQEQSITPSSTESELLRQTMEDGQPHLERRGDEHVLSVPIRLRGQALGAIEFRRPGEPGWSSQALEMAQAVAERLALSLENARLFEQAQTTAQREQLISQVTSQLQTTNDLQTLLTLAAAEFQDALGATRTQVRLGEAFIDSSAEQA
ncbi:MAG: GAF domain-containing protein [Anaerolineae bacterium]|nr:GAF domain-containing protein [Anaerolineae bacterium]